MLDFIIKTCLDNNITPYELGKNTQISTFAAQRILKGETKKPSQHTLNQIILYLEQTIKGFQVPNSDVKNDSIELIRTNKEKLVPYYNIEFSGSQVKNLEELQDYVSFYVDYEPLNDCTAFVPYYGDSMLPKYKSGDALGVKQIKNFDALLWGESHLVITNDNANNIKTVKNIHQHKDLDKVILRAINPEYAGDTVIDKGDILSMFLVKGKVELNQL